MLEKAQKTINFTPQKNDLNDFLSILPPKPDFFEKGDFKAHLLKIYETVGELIETMYDEPVGQSIKADSCFYIYRDNANQLKVLITPYNSFLFYLKSKGSRARIVTEYINIPQKTENGIEFSEKEGLIISLDDFIEYFLYLHSSINREEASESAIFYSLCADFAIKLAESYNLIPQIKYEKDSRFKVSYVPFMQNSAVREVTETLREIKSNIIFFDENKNIINFELKEILALFLNHIVHKALFIKPLKVKNSNIINLFIKNLVLKVESQEGQNFADEINEWLFRLIIGSCDYTPVIKFEKIQNKNKQIVYDVTIEIINRNSPEETPLPFNKVILEEKGLNYSDILKQLKYSSVYFPELGKIVDDENLKSFTLGADAAFDIITRTARTLERLGVLFKTPKELTKVVSPKVVARPKLRKKNLNPELFFAESKDSALKIDDILSFSYEVSLGDKTITKEEFEELIKDSDGIIEYDGQYILLNPGEIDSMLKKLDQEPPKLKNSAEFLHTAFSGLYQDVEFYPDEAIKKVLENIVRIEDIDTPHGLNATLRPYQERGFKWLYSNMKKGFGSCLADDMGLGKTIQVLSLILKLKEDNKLDKPALVVCPTTLIGNWYKESNKFAPDLNAYIYHGPDRVFSEEKVDIVITTYTMLRMDFDKFKDRDWKVLIVDEAQNIKNPETAQTLAIKSIKAENNIAMSGTPVENRLTELWSIFDFINVGYLADLSTFQKSYAIPIERNHDLDKAEKLCFATSPFLMRRLKTDKTIISDLPDKIVFDEYCYLSKEQAVLYQKTLESTVSLIERSAGIQRKGLIFKLITALKQICNHPALYQESAEIGKALSGKSEKALSILENLIESNEKALIFTQYKGMGEILQKMIEKELGEKSYFFHGSLSTKKRDKIVEDFQTKDDVKFLILSLKAGGTGLNLTAANNIIHYDLWWNPAVEDQATDRAYRIGQDKNVIIHRLITLGTFEEKIDEMIKNKRELANLTVSAGENWLSELSNEELMEIFSLNRF
ncbi:MAG: DEAD/DEAH box helicase [bacterium]